MWGADGDGPSHWFKHWADQKVAECDFLDDFRTVPPFKFIFVGHIGTLAFMKRIAGWPENIREVDQITDVPVNLRNKSKFDELVRRLAGAFLVVWCRVSEPGGHILSLRHHNDFVVLNILVTTGMFG